MEFRFDLKPIFTQPIVRVGANLLPHTFRGDRRTALDTSTKMQEIINTVGENSARAQGLTKAVTTAQKIRQSENQKIYLLADVDDGNRGSVIGMLKVGTKSLYVFDQSGTTQMVDAPCILDFYIHESRQRAGLGKDLFETMIQEEQWDPRKLAVDRPSDKLLGFLKKHYNLEKTIPQLNNFVIFDGFFDHADKVNVINNHNYNNQDIKVTSSPNTALFGPLISSDEKFRRNRTEQTASLNNPLSGIFHSPIGRYAAARPTCSMAEFKNMTKAATSRPVIEKRSGLQDVDVGSYYQMQFGNRSQFANPQMPSPIDPQVIQQQMQQLPQQLQQHNVTPQQYQQQQLPPQQMQQQIYQHQMPPCQQTAIQPQQQQLAQQVVPQTMSQQQIPQQQMSQQQIPQQQMSQQQIPQQISQQQIPQQQQQQQMQLQDIPEHHACHHHEIAAEQAQHQQMPQQQQMHCQMNNQQMMAQQQPPTAQMVNGHVEGLQPGMYHETCPNCAATFVCTVVNPGMIIHSSAVKKSTGEPNSSNDDDQQSNVTHDDIEAVRAHFEQLETSDLITEPDQTPNEELEEAEPEPEPELEPEHGTELIINMTPSEAGTNGDFDIAAGASTHNADQAKGHNLVNVRFKNNKQHTGMKNMSFGVGAAVTPTTKMEFYEEPSADFGVVKINQPSSGKKFHDDNASIISSATSSDGFTAHGYCDIKFHHNKLW